MNCCGKLVLIDASYCAYCGGALLCLDKTYDLPKIISLSICYESSSAKINTEEIKNNKVSLRVLLSNLIDLILSKKSIKFEYNINNIDIEFEYENDRDSDSDSIDTDESCLHSKIIYDISKLDLVLYYYKEEYKNYKPQICTRPELNIKFSIEDKVFGIDKLLSNVLKIDNLFIYCMNNDMNDRISLLSELRKSGEIYIKKDINNIEAIMMLLGLNKE